MTSAFQSIGNSLGGIVGTGIAAGATAGSGGGTPNGKFSFSPEELESIAKDWITLALGYRDSRFTASRVQITGPGNEDASNGQAQAATGSWTSYLDSLDQKYNYAIGQATKCAGALAAYLGTDEDSVLRMMMPGDLPTSTPGGI